MLVTNWRCRNEAGAEVEIFRKVFNRGSIMRQRDLNRHTLTIEAYLRVRAMLRNVKEPLRKKYSDMYCGVKSIYLYISKWRAISLRTRRKLQSEELFMKKDTENGMCAKSKQQDLNGNGGRERTSIQDKKKTAATWWGMKAQKIKSSRRMLFSNNV